MGAILAPQTKELVPMFARPTACDLRTLVGERQHDDLGVNLYCPWRERDKATGEWAAAAHVGCCVFVARVLQYPFCRVEHQRAPNPMLIFSPYFKARQVTIMLPPITARTPSCIEGV